MSEVRIQPEVTIRATPIIARDLQPGDLFSTASQEYWDGFPAFGSIGERVYIRTSAPAEDADDPDMEVFRVEIVRK